MYVNGEIELTGRNAQEVAYHSAVSIRDTANNDSNPPVDVDISVLSGRKSLMVYSTLNQVVTISVLVKNKAGTSIIAGSKNIAAATYGIITAVDIPALAEPWQSITLRAACTVAPTAGNLTTVLQGVQA